LGLVDALFLTVLLVGLPILSLLQLPLLSDVVLERTPAYVSSIVTILSVGLISFALGGRTFGIEAMGLGSTPAPEVLTWTGALSLLAALLIAGFWFAGQVFDLQESPILRQLLPKTRAEKGIFVILSLSAGFGEELAFRGFGVLALGSVLGSLWLALAISTVSFALVHAYQGVVGLVRTYLLGLLLGASFLLTGSLWAAIITHAMLDLVGGLVVGERLMGPAREQPIHAAG